MLKLKLRRVETVIKSHQPLYPEVHLPDLCFDDWDERYDDMEQGEPIEEHDQVTPQEMTPRGEIVNVKFSADTRNFDEQIEEIHKQIKHLHKPEVVKIENRQELKDNKKAKAEKASEEIQAKKSLDNLIKQGKLVTSERTKRKIQLED